MSADEPMSNPMQPWIDWMARLIAQAERAHLRAGVATHITSEVRL